MQRVKNFILYNNGFVLIIMGIVLSGTSALAANEEVRKSVVDSEDVLVAVDNSYIRDVDLKKHRFKAEVVSVEEDDDNFYVTYEFHTIDLVDGAWEKVVKVELLMVNKEQLNGQDLGLYVQKELSQVVEYNKNFLREVQVNEKKKGKSQKTVARKYRGLIGKHLDDRETVFEGYNPVVKPPKVIAKVVQRPPEAVPAPVVEVAVETMPEEEVPEDGEVATTTPPTPPATTTEPAIDVTAPVLTLVGEASMSLVVGESYVDAGATATDDIDGDITDRIVMQGTVDTATEGSYTITYAVSDTAGNEVQVDRVVTVVIPEVTVPPASEDPPPVALKEIPVIEVETSQVPPITPHETTES